MSDRLVDVVTLTQHTRLPPDLSLLLTLFVFVCSTNDVKVLDNVAPRRALREYAMSTALSAALSEQLRDSCIIDKLWLRGCSLPNFLHCAYISFHRVHPVTTLCQQPCTAWHGLCTALYGALSCCWPPCRVSHPQSPICMCVACIP
jgi:hypothetical protein